MINQHGLRLVWLQLMLLIGSVANPVFARSAAEEQLLLNPNRVIAELDVRKHAHLSVADWGWYGLAGLLAHNPTNWRLALERLRDFPTTEQPDRVRAIRALLDGVLALDTMADYTRALGRFDVAMQLTNPHTDQVLYLEIIKNKARAEVLIEDFEAAHKTIAQAQLTYAMYPKHDGVHRALDLLLADVKQSQRGVAEAHARERVRSAVLVLLLGALTLLLIGLAYCLRQQKAQRKALTETNQQLMLALDQAEGARDARQDLLDLIMNEVRTPVGSFLATLNLIEMEVSSAKGRRYLKIGQQSGQLVMRLINDALDLAKLEQGIIELEPQPIRIDTLMKDLDDHLQLYPRHEGVKVTIDLAVTHTQEVLVDARRLQQVMAALCTNALKFTHQGEVQVGVDVQFNGDESCMLRFKVSDSGVGMSEAALEQWLKPGRPAYRDIKPQYGNSGLSLGLTVNLLAAMGSRIEASSKLGKGSVFGFTLTVPLPNQTLSDTYQAAVGQQPLQGMNLLVVDDVESNRLLLVRALESWGATAVAASQGEEALAALSTNSPPIDLVLMDLDMPVMDGYEATRRIRAFMQAPQAHLPILAVTGNKQSDLFKAAWKRGFSAAVSKPVNLMALLALIQDHRYTRFIPQNPDEEGTPERNELQGARVLIVEDVNINLIVAKAILKNLGAHVETAENGLQAVTRLCEENLQVDLVLMDVQMPVMDGYEATRRIRASDAAHLKELPIVALSGNVEPEDQALALAAGMSGYLSKPINREAVCGLAPLLRK